ncbi:hypothetical protein OCOJLMKI_0341 [Methylobacterium iners]|uniref:Uncharacterized protein n=1 Tax=Methylobacterium iners TaxID=418707 RepID=A0ABQ4RQV9_9HYPH|nr:hypothetical protein OCOJLMKI_0341 [Methylobacterium iners]
MLPSLRRKEKPRRRVPAGLKVASREDWRVIWQSARQGDPRASFCPSRASIRFCICYSGCRRLNVSPNSRRSTRRRTKSVTAWCFVRSRDRNHAARRFVRCGPQEHQGTAQRRRRPPRRGCRPCGRARQSGCQPYRELFEQPPQSRHGHQQRQQRRSWCAGVERCEARPSLHQPRDVTRELPDLLRVAVLNHGRGDEREPCFAIVMTFRKAAVCQGIDWVSTLGRRASSRNGAPSGAARISASSLATSWSN